MLAHLGAGEQDGSGDSQGDGRGQDEHGQGECQEAKAVALSICETRAVEEIEAQKQHDE